MDEKNKLLNQLRIDRDADVSDGSTRHWVLIGCSIVLVLALAAGAWWALSRPGGMAVHEAVARAVGGESGGSSAGASILDASGYVVARRLATVASKTTGRVVEVAIEEGQRVDKGQVIARLDDSNTRATLEQARAQLGQAEASLAAAKVALDDAKPIFARNEQQLAAAVISAQTFDNAKAAYNAAESDYVVRQRAVEVARAALAVAQRAEEASHAPASAPSSTWTRSRSKWTSARTSSIACIPGSLPPSSSMPTRTGTFPPR